MTTYDARNKRPVIYIDGVRVYDYNANDLYTDVCETIHEIEQESAREWAEYNALDDQITERIEQLEAQNAPAAKLEAARHDEDAAWRTYNARETKREEFLEILNKQKAALLEYFKARPKCAGTRENKQRRSRETQYLSELTTRESWIAYGNTDPQARPPQPPPVQPPPGRPQDLQHAYKFLVYDLTKSNRPLVDSMDFAYGKQPESTIRENAVRFAALDWCPRTIIIDEYGDTIYYNVTQYPRLLHIIRAERYNAGTYEREPWTILYEPAKLDAAKARKITGDRRPTQPQNAPPAAPQSDTGPEGMDPEDCDFI